jgi:hypothetical protein
VSNLAIEIGPILRKYWAEQQATLVVVTILTFSKVGTGLHKHTPPTESAQYSTVCRTVVAVRRFETIRIKCDDGKNKTVNVGVPFVK